MLDMHFSGRFLYTMMQFAQAQGAKIGELIEISGYSVENLLREDTMVNSHCYNKVITSAIDLTGDKFFGLHAGQQMSLTAAGLIGQITRSSATVGEALQYGCDYINLGCRAIPKTLVELKDCFKLTISPNPLWLQQDQQVVRQTTDGLLAFTIREFGELTLNRHKPTRIDYFWKIDSHEQSVYENAYGIPLRSGQRETAIYFGKEQMSAPVITGDFNMLRVLVNLANEKLEQSGSEKFSEIVKQTMLKLVGPGLPGLEEVAQNLNMGPRTLQRRLQPEGITFKAIVEELKKDFALSYLKNKEFSVNQIAHLLDYSDGSTFIRSFKNWTGETPMAYRQSFE